MKHSSTDELFNAVLELREALDILANQSVEFEISLIGDNATKVNFALRKHAVLSERISIQTTDDFNIVNEICGIKIRVKKDRLIFPKTKLRD